MNLKFLKKTFGTQTFRLERLRPEICRIYRNLQEAQKQLEEADARYNETLKKHREWKKNADLLRKTLNEEKSKLTEAPIDARRSDTINTELITINKNEEKGNKALDKLDAECTRLEHIVERLSKQKTPPDNLTTEQKTYANSEVKIDTTCINTSEMLQKLNLGMQAILENITMTQNHTQYSVMPDLSKNIEDFDASGSSATARIWLDSVESMSTLHRWPQDVLLGSARMHLKGAARDWYLTYARNIKNWNDFQRKFKASFIKEKSLTSKWEEMSRRRQHDGEDVTKYFYSKVRLCSELHLSEEEIRDQVALGFTSREISNAVKSKSYPSLDELHWDIKNFEDFHNKRREVHYKTKEKIQNKPIKNKNQETPANDNMTATSDTKNEDKSCYNCGKRGHYARYCKSLRELKCYKCNGRGHIAKECENSNKIVKEVNFIESS